MSTCAFLFCNNLLTKCTAWAQAALVNTQAGGLALIRGVSGWALRMDGWAALLVAGGAAPSRAPTLSLGHGCSRHCRCFCAWLTSADDPSLCTCVVVGACGTLCIYTLSLRVDDTYGYFSHQERVFHRALCASDPVPAWSSAWAGAYLQGVDNLGPQPGSEEVNSSVLVLQHSSVSAIS